MVALDVNGIEQGGSQFPLVNDILERVEAGESVIVNVMTDIVIPERSVNLLTVEGMVFKEGSTTSAGGGLDVMVTVGSTPTPDGHDRYGTDLIQSHSLVSAQLLRKPVIRSPLK